MRTELNILEGARPYASSLRSSSATMSQGRIRRCGVHCGSSTATAGRPVRIGQTEMAACNSNTCRSRVSLKIVLACAPGLIEELISLLDAMDDLNSAASSIMNLLARLLASDSAEK